MKAALLLPLFLLAACETDAITLGAEASDTDTHIAALEERLAELEAEQAVLAEALATCLDLADDAAANAAAAQARVSELEAELDGEDPWTRLDALEASVVALWHVVEGD